MKKLFTVLLMLVFVMSSAMTAFAEETALSLDKAGLGRGVNADESQVKNNDDGSLYVNGVNVSFYLPEVVNASQTVKVTIKGSSDGDFRVWLIDVNETTNSNQYKMSEHGFTSGEFDVTFELVATAPSTELFFKAPSWDGAINNLVIKSLTVDYAMASEDTYTVTVTEEEEAEDDGYVEVDEDEVEVEDEDMDEVLEDDVDVDVEEEEAVAVPTEKPAAKKTSLPKTGVATTALVWGVAASLTGLGFVVSKKKDNE